MLGVDRAVGELEGGEDRGLLGGWDGRGEDRGGVVRVGGVEGVDGGGADAVADGEAVALGGVNFWWDGGEWGKGVGRTSSRTRQVEGERVVKGRVQR